MLCCLFRSRRPAEARLFSPGNLKLPTSVPVHRHYNTYVPAYSGSVPGTLVFSNQDRGSEGEILEMKRNGEQVIDEYRLEKSRNF